MIKLRKKRFTKTEFSLILVFIVILLFIQGTTLMLKVGLMTKNVYGESMAPTLNDGDEVLYISPSFKKIVRGSIVSIKVDDSTHYVKRVIGLPNEKVSIKGVNVYINDELLEEPYVYYGEEFKELIDSGILMDKNGTWTLGKGQYFVVGDNRVNSYDSRDFGPVSKEYIIQIAIRLPENN